MALRTKSKSSLFLIEMIIVILVFSIASAICVSLFVQARLTSLESTQLTMSLGRCQNAVECLKATGDDPAALKEILGAEPVGPGRYQVGYNAEGEEAPLESARYILEITLLREEPDLLHANITFTEPGSDKTEPIYAIKTTQYQPE